MSVFMYVWMDAGMDGFWGIEMHSTLVPLRGRSAVRHFMILNDFNKQFLLSIKTGSVFI